MGDGGGGHLLVRMEWRPAGWSVCLPLVIFPCTIKSRSSLLVPAHPGGPGKRAVKRLSWWWCYRYSGSIQVCAENNNTNAASVNDSTLALSVTTVHTDISLAHCPTHWCLCGWHSTWQKTFLCRIIAAKDLAVSETLCNWNCPLTRHWCEPASHIDSWLLLHSHYTHLTQQPYHTHTTLTSHDSPTTHTTLTSRNSPNTYTLHTPHTTALPHTHTTLTSHNGPTTHTLHSPHTTALPHTHTTLTSHNRPTIYTHTTLTTTYTHYTHLTQQPYRIHTHYTHLTQQPYHIHTLHSPHLSLIHISEPTRPY